MILQNFACSKVSLGQLRLHCVGPETNYTPKEVSNTETLIRSSNQTSWYSALRCFGSSSSSCSSNISNDFIRINCSVAPQCRYNKNGTIDTPTRTRTHAEYRQINAHSTPTQHTHTYRTSVRNNQNESHVCHSVTFSSSIIFVYFFFVFYLFCLLAHGCLSHNCVLLIVLSGSLKCTCDSESIFGVATTAGTIYGIAFCSEACLFFFFVFLFHFLLNKPWLELLSSSSRVTNKRRHPRNNEMFTVLITARDSRLRTNTK